ncbi:MAG: CDP-2,3-bis-(O-geranylgeranyl)-sn-glycerol synthase [Candidatus Diapherotrites archaeon]
MDLLMEITRIFLYIIPFYFANSSAMIFGGKTPLDMGIKLNNHRILGKGKTFKGTIAGILIGTLVAILIQFIYPSVNEILITNYVLFGFLVSVGAMIGDIAGSFFKRRAGIESGEEVLFLDQLDFVFGAIILGSIVYVPDFYEILGICILTLFVHKISNWIAFKLKIKKVPW